MPAQTPDSDHIKASALEPTLPEAAVRALEEAAARRAVVDEATEAPVEINGPKGAEPTRFGDWERKGIASDF